MTRSHDVSQLTTAELTTQRTQAGPDDKSPYPLRRRADRCVPSLEA
jgi:hypothetical protein